MTGRSPRGMSSARPLGVRPVSVTSLDSRHDAYASRCEIPRGRADGEGAGSPGDLPRTGGGNASTDDATARPPDAPIPLWGWTHATGGSGPPGANLVRISTGSTRDAGSTPRAPGPSDGGQLICCMSPKQTTNNIDVLLYFRPDCVRVPLERHESPYLVGGTQKRPPNPQPWLRIRGSGDSLSASVGMRRRTARRPFCGRVVRDPDHDECADDHPADDPACDREGAVAHSWLLDFRP